MIVFLYNSLKVAKYILDIKIQALLFSINRSFINFLLIFKYFYVLCYLITLKLKSDTAVGFDQDLTMVIK